MVRGPQGFASVQPALPCSRRPLLPVCVPMIKRKRGLVLACSRPRGPRQIASPPKYPGRRRRWSGYRLNGDLVAELLEPFNRVPHYRVFLALVVVVDPEVSVFDPVPQHHVSDPQYLVTNSDGRL